MITIRYGKKSIVFSKSARSEKIDKLSKKKNLKFRNTL